MFWILMSSALCLGYVSCGTEYTLEMIIETPSLSEVYLGQKMLLKTTGTFAEAQTTTGVVIELLPSIQSTIFAICKIVSYTKGSKLTTPDTGLDTGDFEGKYDLHYGEEYQEDTLKQRFYDRAVFTIGQVQAGVSGGADADYQITIVYEVVYVSAAGNPDGSEQSMGSGMEYDGGNYIWISICSITIKDTAGVGPSETGDTTFEVDEGGDFHIEVMTPKTIMVTIKSPRSASNLMFDVVGMNSTDVDGFSVQKVELETVGEAYACNTIKENIYVNAYDTCPLQSSLTLDLGKPINTVSKETSPDTTKYALVLRIVLLVDNSNLVGQTVGVGFGFDINGSEMWVYDIGLLVISAAAQAPVTFTAERKTGDETISPGFAGGATVSVTIPRGTNPQFSIDLSTSVKTGAANALSILSITPTSHGNNIPCDIPNSAVNLTRPESASTPGLYESAKLSINISNTNMQPSPTADSDVYNFDVYVMMMGDATEGDIYNLVITIDKNSATEKTMEFTVAAKQDYPENVNYTYTIECGDNTLKLSGSVLSYKVTIDTTLGLTAGNMTIETPIPVNISNSNLEFESAEVIEKGINVACLALGSMSSTVTSWATDSGLRDRAVIEIPLMCNTGIDTSDENANKAVIEVKVRLVDNADINAADRSDLDEFGFGAKIGNKIWVASCSFDIKAPTNDLKRYEGVIIPDGFGPDPFPADLAFQWSPDNIKFYTHNHPFGTGVTSTGSTMYPIDPPVIARYVRVINAHGGNSTDYSFATAVPDDVDFHGSTSSKNILMSHVQFLLDGNATTCLSLPTKTTTDTTTYYWANFKTYVFGINGSSAFTLALTGTGLQCNTLAGPQVTMVLHPKNSDTLTFEGKRRKCKPTAEDIPGPPRVCKYNCECSDEITCADVSLVLYYDGTAPSDYTLCDVTATQ